MRASPSAKERCSWSSMSGAWSSPKPLLSTLLGFQPLPQGANLGQPGLPPCQFLADRVAIRIHAVLLVLRVILRLGLLHQLGNLCLELCLPLLHPAITHRLVLGGIRPQLGPIQGHMP